MRIYASIPSKTSENTEIIRQLRDLKVSVDQVVGEKDIFSAHKRGLKNCVESGAKDDDVLILCHDDVEIISGKKYFMECMKKAYESEELHGVAGTKRLREDAIWWNSMKFPQETAGCVFHGKDWEDCFCTFYGKPSYVAAIDGLFMYAKVSVWKRIFESITEGEINGWNFYDLRYCMSAIKNGIPVYVSALRLLHYSMGEVGNREDWHIERNKFLKDYSHMLPLAVRTKH